VIGLVDTNADPDEAEYVIPGNDDAIRSCDLIARVVADGIAAGRSKVTTTEMSAPAEPAAEEVPDEVAVEPEVEVEVETEAAPEPVAVAEGGETE
jgi:small subunit ribosomal protein S2